MLENEHTVHSVITVFPLHARRVSLQQFCHQYAGPNVMFQKQKMQLYSCAKQESHAWFYHSSDGGVRKLQILPSRESASTMSTCLRSFARSKHDNLNIVISISAENYHFYFCSRTEYVSCPAEESNLLEKNSLGLLGFHSQALNSVLPCLLTLALPPIATPEFCSQKAETGLKISWALFS